MENNKFCSYCGAKNNENAHFCNCCGKEFKSSVNYNATNNKDFISEQEFSTFIGKNQKRFMPQFRKFFTGKKVSFSPLVFLLTLLVSPFASGFWFLHRKMYKIGSIILAIGLLITAFSLYGAFSTMDRVYSKVLPYATERAYSNNTSFESADDFDYFDDFDDDDDYDFSEKYNKNQYDFSNYIKDIIKICKEEMGPFYVIARILDLINIAAAVLLGLFAKYIYFKHSVKEIMSLKSEPEYNLEKVKNKGGTNCIAWVIPMIACILLYLGSIIVFSISLVSTVFAQF